MLKRTWILFILLKTVSQLLLETKKSKNFLVDSENMEATAQFDFIARSDRELSLKKGDTVTLYSQVSNDWWKGAVNGHEGLIPDKYISLKMK